MVEDDDKVRRLVTTVLGNCGYRVLAAHDGQEALTLVRDQGVPPLHLVVTDVVMPVVGGAELVRRLRQDAPGVRVLFMSGYSGGTAVEEAMSLTAGPVLQKPFDPRDLARRVREVLDR